MSGRPPLRRSAAGAIVAILAALVLAADQFVKYLTIENLPLHEPVPVLGEFLQLYYVRNPGAAFSLGSEVTWIFTIALAVVASIIIWKAFGIKSRLWAVVLGCLLGGVLGNLTDRLLREPGFPVGHVVDMISMPWMMPAIFNVADVFIVTGMISVALLVVFGLRFDGTRERDHAVIETEEEAEAAAVAAMVATETDAESADADDAAADTVGADRSIDDDAPSEGAAPASEGR
ncbi:signal peptidase II [Microbacterium sp. MYb45]|uniref:signal peptidase II n=1 Tax=Microbacterium sp. MYb45 TaxID=1827294 RepID=UPI000D010C70|nr:signal peptidase II [Microbacterium sp. MYb45]PRB65562.1 signal peptidase II [Microbacterium sp. MYb45]